MTTVGYGDITPSTIEGRFIVGYPTLVFGVAMIGYTLSVLANMMFETRIKGLRGMKQLKLMNHIIIIHYKLYL